MTYKIMKYNGIYLEQIETNVAENRLKEFGKNSGYYLFRL